MNHSNYVIFEILKYKIEFLDCLEFSLIYENQAKNKKEIKNNFTYLKNELKNGLYKEIVSSLFSSYHIVNKPMIEFIKKYHYKKAIKLTRQKKLSKLLNFNEAIIDCYETFNHIINSFTQENEIAKILDKKITSLTETSNNHFINFLFFNLYNLYLNCFCSNGKLKYKDSDIERLIKIINYCNLTNKFTNSINILKKEDKEEMYKELEN